ncbi:MAG: hypothetical protein IKB34_01135, partial [Clostridia bacterium]|nr:hypothetical protein [Clostridia bacterium]
PNETVSFDHKLYALGKDEHGSIALYKITIEDIFQSYTEPNDYRFHNLRYLREIENVAEDISGSSDQADQPYTANSESSTTNYSISDLFEIVKTFDEKFKPKSVNEHLIDKDTGLPKVFYLPENAAGDWSDGVTVYQNKRVNAQPVYISSYFEDGANPNFEIKDNGDVIVYDAGQVKSVADGGNIGTFDRGAKKIRYSRKTDGDQLLKSLDAGGGLFSVPA